MATRSSIRFATREPGVNFNLMPEKIHAKFYAHWDGYPSHRGVEIAESLLGKGKIEGWEVESLTHNHTDLEFIYYIWQAPGKDTWISIFSRHSWTDTAKDWLCTFVGTPDMLIEKYKLNTNEEG